MSFRRSLLQLYGAPTTLIFRYFLRYFSSTHRTNSLPCVTGKGDLPLATQRRVESILTPLAKIAIFGHPLSGEWEVLVTRNEDHPSK